MPIADRAKHANDPEKLMPEAITDAGREGENKQAVSKRPRPNQ
jgi:hypothetical protein